jgi:hypothetical protein
MYTTAFISKAIIHFIIHIHYTPSPVGVFKHKNNNSTKKSNISVMKCRFQSVSVERERLIDKLEEFFERI